MPQRGFFANIRGGFRLGKRYSREEGPLSCKMPTWALQNAIKQAKGRGQKEERKPLVHWHPQLLPADQAKCTRGLIFISARKRPVRHNLKGNNRFHSSSGW